MSSPAVRTFALALAVGGTACSAAPSTPASPGPIPETRPAREQPPQGAPWQTQLRVDHPLVGRIYHPASRQMISLEDLTAALVQARYVLLGEKHDNPDHHRLQAQLIAALARVGRKPAVALEMLDVEQQPAVDAALSKQPGDVDAIAHAVDWGQSGWPEWLMYRQVFAEAIGAQMPLVAANLPREQVRALAFGQAEAPPDLALPPLTQAQQRELLRELSASHCGHVPESAMTGMATAQRTRDAMMARTMMQADTGQGAVLIAGGGHVRVDRGVPLALRHYGAQGGIVTVGIQEVHKDVLAPKDYEDAPGRGIPFDYVWFTPRVDERDPCEMFTHP